MRTKRSLVNVCKCYSKPLSTNVMRCKICGGPVDRYSNRLECQNNTNHVADLITAEFFDTTTLSR